MNAPVSRAVDHGASCAVAVMVAESCRSCEGRSLVSELGGKTRREAHQLSHLIR